MLYVDASYRFMPLSPQCIDKWENMTKSKCWRDLLSRGTYVRRMMDKWTYEEKSVAYTFHALLTNVEIGLVLYNYLEPIAPNHKPHITNCKS